MRSARLPGPLGKGSRVGGGRFVDGALGAGGQQDVMKRARRIAVELSRGEPRGPGDIVEEGRLSAFE